MSNRKTVFGINDHFQKNFWLYVVSLLCIFTGIVLGIYAVKYMGNYEQEELLGYLTSFTKNVSQTKFRYDSMFLDIVKNNIPIILAIWFLGLTMVGIPVILILDVIKGFTVGFTLSFMIKGFGAKGLGIVLLGVLPQNLLYIPCVMVASVIAMEFSLGIFRDKINKQWISNIWIKIASYSVTFVIVLLVMSIGFLVETFITPNLVRLII